jgi:hypothetical protein
MSFPFILVNYPASAMRRGLPDPPKASTTKRYFTFQPAATMNNSYMTNVLAGAAQMAE